MLTIGYYWLWNVTQKLFIPVEPSTSYNTLLTRSLHILAKSDAIPPQEIESISFEDIKVEDAALFIAGSAAVGGATKGVIRYVKIDGSKDNIISKMGFKDGADAVAYLGFRAKGKSKSLQEEEIERRQRTLRRAYL